MGHDFRPVNGGASPDRYSLLRSYAHNLRFEPTVAEIRLWECLRGNQLGVRFRRQHVIGDYIADFVCLREMLIVEVDGEYHSRGEQIEADRTREEALSQMGFRILRFTNDDVLFKIEYVLETIRNSFILTR